MDLYISTEEMWKVIENKTYVEKYQVTNTEGPEVRHGWYQKTAPVFITTGRYAQNLKDGLWITKQGPFSLSDGDKKYASKTTSEYQNGKLHGEVKQSVYSHSLGGWQVTKLETYQNGRLEGPFQSYHRDGTLDIAGRHLNGTRQGEWTRARIPGKDESVEQRRYYWNNYFLLNYDDRLQIPKEFRIAKIKDVIPAEHRTELYKDHQGPWLEIYIGKEATRLPLHPCKHNGPMLRKDFFAKWWLAGGW